MATSLEVRDAIKQNAVWCQEELKFLCTKFLDTKHWSEVHTELAKFLETAGNRIHIELPRGHLKSWIVTQGWTVQQMLRNPDLRILIVNAVESNATKMVRFIRSYLGKGGYLATMFGNFETDVWSQEELVIRQRRKIQVAPTYMAAGLQKTLTSQHFDIIIADDLVEPDNVRTKEQREKVHEFYLSLFDLLEPQGKIVVIGTRYHQDDLYARILEENEQHKNWSVFIRSCYKADGSVLFPEKFSFEQLDDIKKKSFYHFSTQYLNNPIDPENADFRDDQIEYYEPGTTNPHSLVICVDPAASLGRDADFTGFTVSGMFKNRRIRLCEAFRKKCVPFDIIDTLFDLVAKWRKAGHSVRVVIETFGFAVTLKAEIDRRMRQTGIFFPVFEFKKRRGPQGENNHVKEARIRSLQPFFQQHLYEIAPYMTDFKDELLTFPRGKHDDLIDSASMAIPELVPSLETHTPSKPTVHGTMGWWVKNHMRKPEESVYGRFFADMK